MKDHSINIAKQVKKFIDEWEEADKLLNEQASVR